jgi:hypothetical protein
VKRLVVWGTGTLALSAGVMSAALLSTAVASSDPGINGLTYGQAKAKLDAAGIEIVKKTKYGNGPLEKCIVTSSSITNIATENLVGGDRPMATLFLKCNEDAPPG